MSFLKVIFISFIPEGLMGPEEMTDIVDNGKSDLKKEKISQRLPVGTWVLEEEC